MKLNYSRLPLFIYVAKPDLLGLQHPTNEFRVETHMHPTVVAFEHVEITRVEAYVNVNRAADFIMGIHFAMAQRDALQVTVRTFEAKTKTVRPVSANGVVGSEVGSGGGHGFAPIPIWRY